MLSGNWVVDGLARGIYAPNGAVDRGANRAQGNGLDPQCTGVTCS